MLILSLNAGSQRVIRSRHDILSHVGIIIIKDEILVDWPFSRNFVIKIQLDKNKQLTFGSFCFECQYMYV